MSEVGKDFNPFTPEEVLQLRYEAVGAFLTGLVGEMHPRLMFPEQRYTIGDNAAAQLTYDAIIRRIPDEHSPDLPEGAVRNVDPTANLTLMERHLADINGYLLDGCSRSKDLASTGLSFYELPEVHPIVEGYAWYRGHQVYTGEDSSVIVLDPWMQPWSEGGSPTPILYTLGSPTAAQVQEVAVAYTAETAFA